MICQSTVSACMLSSISSGSAYGLAVSLQVKCNVRVAVMLPGVVVFSS